MKRVYVIVSMIALLFNVLSIPPLSHETTVAQAGNCDWIMFRGNPQHTGVAQDGCGPKTNDLEAQWGVKVDMNYLSSECPSPVVVNGKLFIGSDNSMQCIDTNDGKQIWSFKTGGRIESTATVANGKVYFGSNDEYLYCLNEVNGNEIWSFKSDIIINSSPLFSNNKLYFHDEYYTINCLDANDGKTIWDSKSFYEYFSWGSASSPIISNDGLFLFFAAHNKIFHCLKTFDGTRVWEFETKDEVFSSPAISEENIVFGCNDGNIYSLNLITGSKNWSFRTENEVMSSPCLYNSKVFIGTKDGYFACIDVSNGKLLWKYNSDDTQYSSAVASAGKIYFGGDKGNIYILDSETGRELGHIFMKGQSFISQPTLTEGKIYICSLSDLYCIVDKPPQKAAKVIIEPSSSEIQIGESAQLNAIIYDDKDKKMDGDITWTTDNLDIISISKSGKIIGKKVGQANIKACFRDIYATAIVTVYDSNVVESISITPSKATVRIGEQINFSATAYNYKGNPLENISFHWTVSPSEIGTITQDGVFRAVKNGECDVIAQSSNIDGKSRVIVLAPKNPANVVVTPIEINCGQLDPGTVKEYTLNLINNGEETAFVSIATNDDWIVLKQSSANIESFESAKIVFEVRVDQSEKESKKQGNIAIKWDDKSINVKITFEIKQKQPKCDIRATPTQLYYGKIQRGKSQTMPFALDFQTQSEIKGLIKSSNPWIEVSPREFTTIGKSVEGTVTIKASALPAGESFEGFIAINAGDACQVVKIPVYVKTDKSIVLDLILGNKNAQLNGENMELDVPPQSIKGRTLVPIRFISESFGCKVEWEASTGKITISRHDFVIVLWKDKTKVLVNGKDATLDVPASIVSGRTLVPVRFISEAFGAKVVWEAATKRITINWDPI